MLEDVFYVIGFEAVIYGDGDGARGRDAEYRFEEGGRVGRKDAYAFVAVLAEVVCQAARAVRGLDVRPAEDLVVGCDMVDGGCLYGMR